MTPFFNFVFSLLQPAIATVFNVFGYSGSALPFSSENKLAQSFLKASTGFTFIAF